MHFGYSLYADHKEEHVIVKKENSNRTYYDEVNSDKTSLLSRTIFQGQFWFLAFWFLIIFILC